jgi:hypothetical protein
MLAPLSGGVEMYFAVPTSADAERAKVSGFTVVSLLFCGWGRRSDEAL